MKTAIIAVILTGLSLPVLAANANEPDKNMDKSNDQGGPTGNDKTDELNRAQQTPPAPSAPSPTLTTPAPGSPASISEKTGKPVVK